MADTINFGYPMMDAAASLKSVDYNDAIKMIDVLMTGVVESVVLTAPPGSPAEGAMWAVPAAATGLWAGQGGNLALFIGGGWAFKTPPPSLKFVDKVTGASFTSTGAGWAAAAGWIEEAPVDGTAYARQDGAWVVVSASGGAYDFGIAFGGTPAASEVMGRLSLPRTTTCPANFAGSAGHVGANPAAAFDIDVQDDGVSIGTISIATDGSFTFATTGGLEQVIAGGSLVTFIAPAAVDATLIDISATLIGNV